MMTDNEARALGERWIRAGGDARPGMLMLYGSFYAIGREDGDQWWGRVTNPADVRRGQVPDLRDPATRGAALDVVRERWGEPSYSLTAVDESYHPIRWAWVDGGLAAPMLDHKIGYQQFDSEAEALVAALEASPLR